MSTDLSECVLHVLGEDACTVFRILTLCSEIWPFGKEGFEFNLKNEMKLKTFESKAFEHFRFLS